MTETAINDVLSDSDHLYLEMAVDLSRGYLDDPRRWPFGAVLVIDGDVAALGVNQVTELADPTAHAEIMTLRAAGQTLIRHQFESATLYSSSEPCPMCLAACYWASVNRVVFAARTVDVASYGLKDLAIYDEISRPADRRTLTEIADETLHEDATAALRNWARRRHPRE